MTVQAGLWTGAAAAALTAVFATVGDWRRGRRRNLDAVGWVPWQGLQMMAILLAVVLAALAAKI